MSATARDRPPEEAPEDTAFARGLRVLLAVADRGEVRADELAASLSMPVSTVYRYLRTLAVFGFVDRREGRFWLGPRLLIGGGSLVTSERLIRAAEPVLRSLADRSGETAVVMRRIGLAAVCLHEVPSEQPLRVSVGAGSMYPLHTGAMGRVLLAYAPAEVVDEVIAAASQGAAEPLDDVALRSELERVRGSGWAADEDDLAPGLLSIAVPLLRPDGIVATLGLVAPTSRTTGAWVGRAKRLLRSGAELVIAELAAEET